MNLLVKIYIVSIQLTPPASSTTKVILSMATHHTYWFLVRTHFCKVAISKKYIKFVFSKKATKFDKIITVDLTLT